MRRPLILLSLSLGLSVTISAQQRVPVSAPAPVVRAMPVAPAASHVTPAHTAVPSRPAMNRAPLSTANNAKPVVSHRHSPVSGPARPPVGVGTPVHSGNGNSGSHVVRNCNFGFKYPVQGLNGCTTSVVPSYGSAYFIPVPYYYGGDEAVENQELPQANAEDVAPEMVPDEEQAAESQEPDQEREPAVEPEAHTRRAPAPAANLNDSLAQFVFVQRDGTKVYAVAYSFTNDKLHYVTKEGVRRSLAVDSLDFDATQKSNEQLGNQINLPSNLPASGDALNIPPRALR